MTPRAKDIVVKPIKSGDANAICAAIHYSGKVVPNSQLHFGVFLNGKCGGVMQFGPSFDKRKLIGLVRDTQWNGFLELNRMAFADWLPRNSESRALGVALRMIRKEFPYIEWIVSFSDATQCGDGTIYRASGFVLTQIRKNSQIYVNDAGETIASMTVSKDLAAMAAANGKASVESIVRAGYRKAEGYMLRYVYFLNRAARARLTVPELPFSDIDRAGARMYKGRAGKLNGSGSVSSGD